MTNRGLTRYGCWINGAETPGRESYPLLNPSTGETFAQIVAADRDLVDLALKSASENLGKWRSVDAPQRSEILHALAARIRREQEALALLLCREVGKPLQAAREEVVSAAHLIDYFAEESLRLAGRIPLLGYNREQVLILREPVGVCVAITPFNYPLSTLACKAAPALAVGCSVVVKPDEHTPLSTLKLAQLAVEEGLPPGVFNVVNGPGQETGRFLVDHRIPRLVTFTGSTEVGKDIQRLSAKWVRKVILELGGHCPAIVCRDAPWLDLLPQILWQSFKNSGQYCYRISRIYVAREIYEDFLAAFIRLASAVRVGSAEDPSTELGPLNHEEILSRLCLQVEQAKASGARVEIGGVPLDAGQGGFYYPPTVLTGVRPGMAIMQQEVFGPVALFSSFADIRDAIRDANATCYGLAAYLFTQDLAQALEWTGQLEAGSIWVNRIHQAYPEAPFGGVKESGLGREKSLFGIEEFTELKTVYLSY